MSDVITAKQKVVLAFIQDFTRKHGKPPTYVELKKALGYAGISSVQRHVDALRKKNILRNEKHQARSFKINLPTEQSVNIPLVGNVACGLPLLAEENIEAYIPYSGRLKGNSSDYFFLRAVGDSMDNTDISGKTICDGDFVLIHKQQTARPGDRVVALLGDEATIKKLQPTDGHYILQPESSNPKNKPIYVFDDFVVQGIVCDVINRRSNSKN